MRALGLLGTILRNRRGRDARPRLLTHAVTFRCNARCVMCDSWRLEGKNDLSLEEIERIYVQLPKLDLVRLTGGEPFVRKDLPAIATAVRAHLDPAVLHVTSNGFLTERIIRFCEERDRSRRLALLISVDGVGAAHDRIRGREGAWERAWATLTALAPRQRELRLQLAVNQTIVDREGLDQHRALVEQLRPLGLRPNAVLAYEESATYSTERGIDATAGNTGGTYRAFGRFGPEELERLLDALEGAASELRWPERLAKRYYYRGLRARLLHGTADPNPSCVALHNHLRIFPDGSVPTCQFNTKSVGNLRERPFTELWSGGGAIDEQRNWVRACAGCWAECEVLPNALYTGDLLEKTLLPASRRNASDACVPTEAAGVCCADPSR